MSVELLDKAIAAVPAGAWAVGVSGGADSVALLALLRRRSGLRLHAVHLDHETREGQSAADAQFVAELCARDGVPCTIARRSELEPLAGELPANRSARFRALRLALFQTVCKGHGLSGVILAHHSADQAETIFQRLARGSGPAGLVGMRTQSRIGGLTILRPLLSIAPEYLRDLLRTMGQPWREDASNASPAYQRNRIRSALQGHPVISVPLLEMAEAMATLTAWARTAAPVLAAEFVVCELADTPEVLANEAARRWLYERGAPRGQLTPTVLGRLIEMARDAATAPRQHFPGGMLVGRRGGKIFVVNQSNSQ
jgi:tRNA(Ile)-lysidine synthetase-like protein